MVFILRVSYTKHKAWVKQINMKDLKNISKHLTNILLSYCVLEVWVLQQLLLDISIILFQFKFPS